MFTKKYLNIFTIKDNTSDLNILTENYFNYLNRIIESELQKNLRKGDMFFLSQPLIKMLRAHKNDEVSNAISIIEKSILPKISEELNIHKIIFVDIKYKLCEDKQNKYKIAHSCLETIKENQNILKNNFS